MNPKSETVSLFQGLLEGEEGRLGVSDFCSPVAPSRENRENLSRYVFMMIFSPYGFESRWAHQLLPTNNVGVVANQRSQRRVDRAASPHSAFSEEISPILLPLAFAPFRNSIPTWAISLPIVPWY